MYNLGHFITILVACHMYLRTVPYVINNIHHLSQDFTSYLWFLLINPLLHISQGEKVKKSEVWWIVIAVLLSSMTSTMIFKNSVTYRAKCDYMPLYCNHIFNVASKWTKELVALRSIVIYVSLWINNAGGNFKWQLAQVTNEINSYIAEKITR
jgi:hypothetical protein